MHGPITTNGHAERATLEWLVGRVVAVLDQGRTTKFEYEGACRALVRVRFILDGKSWAQADLLAATVVRRALDIIGAVRPSWWEAQPEFTRTAGAGRINCANAECARPIDRQGFQAMYCSEACRLAAKRGRAYAEHQGERVAYAQARRDQLRAQGEIRNCEWCSLEFRALDYGGKKPQRFCSLTCRSRFASSCAAAWRPYRLPHQRPL